MSAEKQTAPRSVHSGHRARVRNLFLQGGLDGFSDHNILELLLFYCVPQGDTNVTAHNLIERFGSLRGVLDATVEELCSVNGMGMYSATYLSIFRPLFHRYCADEARDEAGTETRGDAPLEAFFRSRFVGEVTECVYLLGFDANGQKIGCSRVLAGTHMHVDVNERQILEAAFHMKAVSVVIGHNHPGGVAAPSNDDIEATKRIARALRCCSIRLLDHIIVAGNECFSMAKHPRCRAIFL